jgi:uncharacterized protein
MFRSSWIGLAILVVFARLAAAQSLDNSLESYIRLHYEKHEHQIPMRDGVKLFTSVFVPKDTNRKYPLLMKRTPYSVAPYGEDKYPTSLGPSDHTVKAGYIFINQDVRGRFMSEGEFVEVTPHRPAKKAKTDIDESSDTYDTIDWLLKNTTAASACTEFRIQASIARPA